MVTGRERAPRGARRLLAILLLELLELRGAGVSMTETLDQVVDKLEHVLVPGFLSRAELERYAKLTGDRS